MKPWERWSASKLSLLLFKCPLSFYYEYVEAGAKGKVAQNIQKLFGSSIHYMLEDFFKKNYKSMEGFIRAWMYHFLTYTLKIKYIGRIRMIGNRTESDYVGAGIAILKKFWYDNLAYRDGQLPRPETEKIFHKRFKGHNITGVIDRIQPIEDGEEIWDYKTGYKKPKDAELFRDVQFTFYNLAHLMATGRDPIKMRLVQLSSSEQFVVPTRTEADYIQLGCWLDEATIFVRNILEPQPQDARNFSFRYLNPEDIDRKHFPKRPSDFCGLCDYDILCRSHQPTDSLRGYLVRRELQKIETTPRPAPSEQLGLLFPKKKLFCKQKPPQK
jgi:hypothetical protein